MSEEEMPKILVVDDEPINVELLEAYLTGEYNILTAYNGEEALEKVKNEHPDLILLDIMMPGMDGYEVCRILKNDSKTQFIPIVMVTALSERNDRIKSIEVEADEFLTKPVDKVELMARVKSLMHAKHLHNSLVSERNVLDVQNRIRSVLTAMIPILLKPLPPEQKKIVIHQMTDMVEKTILEIYPIDTENTDIECIGDICANVMNQLGATFISESSEEGMMCTVKGTVCPWGGDEARRNPILCNLTRGIFSRIVARAPGNREVQVLKTIGNGDECCLFKINMV